MVTLPCSVNLNGSENLKILKAQNKTATKVTGFTVLPRGTSKMWSNSQVVFWHRFSHNYYQSHIGTLKSGLTCMSQSGLPGEWSLNTGLACIHKSVFIKF